MKNWMTEIAEHLPTYSNAHILSKEFDNTSIVFLATIRLAPWAETCKLIDPGEFEIERFYSANVHILFFVGRQISTPIKIPLFGIGKPFET